MADFVFFVSNLDQNSENDYQDALVIDIKGASEKDGAALQVFPRKPNCYDNQLWQSVQSNVPTGGGGWWYFLKSKSTGFVITADGNSVKVSKQKAAVSDDQLWDFNFIMNDGFGVAWYTIQSKQNNNVISVKGSSKKAVSPLELDSPNNGANQLWFEQGP